MRWPVFGLPAAMFFPDRDELELPAYRAAVARAKAVCNRCRVATECLEEAFVVGPDGVWGGTTHAERRLLRWNAGAATTAGDRGAGS